MNGLAFVGMIGWFALSYLIVAGFMFVAFYMSERHKMQCGDRRMSLHELLQVAQSLTEKPMLFAFLKPFIWFMGLWLHNNKQ